MKRKHKVQQTAVGLLLPADMHSYGEASKLLRLSVRTLQHYVKSGKLRCERVGRRVYFTDIQLLDWVESCRRGEND